MKFVYNDGGRSKYFKAEKVGDCVVRSICNASGLDYSKIAIISNDDYLDSSKAVYIDGDEYKEFITNANHIAKAAVKYGSSRKVRE